MAQKQPFPYSDLEAAFGDEAAIGEPPFVGLDFMSRRPS
jgi:hypothetical protein